MKNMFLVSPKQVWISSDKKSRRTFTFWSVKCVMIFTISEIFRVIAGISGWTYSLAKGLNFLFEERENVDAAACPWLIELFYQDLGVLRFK